jgi:hypothetical protein
MQKTLKVLIKFCILTGLTLYKQKVFGWNYINNIMNFKYREICFLFEYKNYHFKLKYSS